MTAGSVLEIVSDIRVSHTCSLAQEQVVFVGPVLDGRKEAKQRPVNPAGPPKQRAAGDVA